MYACISLKEYTRKAGGKKSKKKHNPTFKKKNTRRIAILAES